MKKLECVTERKLIKMIEEAAKKEGSLSAWATANKVQPSAPSAFVRRVQPAGRQIPAAFGLVPITVFVPKDSDLFYEYPRRNAPPPPPPVKEKKAKKKKVKK